MSDAPQQPTPLNPTPLRLEIGKRYRRHDGHLTGPLERSPNNLGYPFFDPVTGWSYIGDGVFDKLVPNPGRDLVSEYVEPTTPSEPPFTNTSLGKLLDEKSDAALSFKLDAFKSTAWEALDKVAPRHRWASVFVDFKTPQKTSVPDLLRVISDAIRKQDLEPARRDFVDEFLRRVDGLSAKVDNLHEEIDTLRR